MSSNLNFRQRYQLLLEEKSQYVNSSQQILYPRRQKGDVQKWLLMPNLSFPMGMSCTWGLIFVCKMWLDVQAEVFLDTLWYFRGINSSSDLLEIFEEHLQRYYHGSWKRRYLLKQQSGMKLQGCCTHPSVAGTCSLTIPVAIFTDFYLLLTSLMNV